MKRINMKKEEGFTIIEVVLVLAIAGLIFLIVFLALPALQRSQRDTQRRNDLSRLMAQITNYQTNNNNEIPDSGEFVGFVGEYLITVGDGGDEFAAPNGDPYSLNDDYTPVDDGGTTALSENEIGYAAGRGCDATVTGVRIAAAWIALEGGGEYCQDNR